MEDKEREKQYAYKETSNLVLAAEGRSKDVGPSSDVASLLKKYDVRQLGKQFGDRAFRAKAEGEHTTSLHALQAEKTKLKKNKRSEEDASEENDTQSRKRRMMQYKNVLTADIDTSYRPKTRETRAAYEVMLNFLQQEMGDQPHDVLRSAADEVIDILKNKDMKAKDKHREIDLLFHRPKSMDDDRFAKLLNIANRFTDYDDGQSSKEEEKDAKQVMDESEEGVAVVEEEEDEEEDGEEADTIERAFVDEEDEDEDEDEDANMGKDEDGEDETKMLQDTAAGKETSDGHEDMGDRGSKGAQSKDKDEIDPRDIDAFWLQRKLSDFYKDAIMSQKMSEDVLALLGGRLDVRVIESKLVQLLDYDRFAFIKVLLKNRDKIVYCTRLARAQDEEQRKVIEGEMSDSAKLAPILEALHQSGSTSTSTRTGDDTKARGGGAKGGKVAAANSATTTTSTADGAVSASSSAAAAASNASAAGAGSDSGVFWQKRPKALLDMDSLTLAFEAGGHVMSNEDCKLPKNSEIINKKGYQEVHIPPLKAREFADDEKLVKVAEMPDWSRKAFKGMETLNRVQSAVYPTAMLSAENMLICAPTGAGKTNCAMLTMLREIGLYRNADGTVDLDAFKIVYVAPMKSLVQEMVLNFSKRLEPYGITVRELSGDSQLTKQQIMETQVIVTTPEKWDIITRKEGDRTVAQLVKLVIIDEIHLLHDTRGPVLESIVARSIRQIEQTQELIRIVGLSATLPNYEDVAMFLRVKPESGIFFFDNSYRPVPLYQQYIGITQKSAFKRHELLNEITYLKTLEQAGKNQTIVFVHSRKDTFSTARMLRDFAMDRGDLGKFLQEESGRQQLLKDEAEHVKHPGLKELLPYGFAIHHAGMSKDDRTLVEELFADNHIQVLVSTSTLAWGVNLPAHTVIIKGTQVYSPEKGKWVELSPQDVTQMMGRAGRPQYDSTGEGIIITSHKELHFYLSLLNEQLPVESQLLSRLADSLNAEVVLGTIQSIKDAVHWLGYTYLFVRMLRKPRLYGIDAAALADDPLLEQRRVDLAHTAAALLDKHGLLKYDRKSGALVPTDEGRVASTYYLTYQSIASFNQYLKPNMSDIEMFRVFSLASEFQYMSVREEEKLELARLLDKVPVPVKESIDEGTAKVNVLLQTYISRLSLEGYALSSDMVFITQSAARLMRALFEIMLRRGWAQAALKALTLSKMVQHRMWSAQSPLRQFSFIPEDVIKKIESKDFPWDRFYDLEPHAIGELVRFPKMGKPVWRAVHQLPRLDLVGHVQPITRSVLRVELTITPDFELDEKVHGNAEPFWIIVEDVDGETILHHEYFVLKKKFQKEEHVLTFTVPIFDPLPPQYFVRCVSDRWIGSEAVLPISFRHLILPEKFPPLTELLDLQPLPVTDVASEAFMQLFPFDLFNPVQTQVFNAVYKRDDSVFVAAPVGSGKTVLAELAMMRLLTNNRAQGVAAKAVYVAPKEEVCKIVFAQWTASFGKKLKVPVRMLTGEVSTDLQLMKEATIVVCTPENWDIMSRRWKTRKDVQAVRLIVCDDVHLVGANQGPVLEVIVSRMRYISAQIEQHIRMVGLSSSVANGRDLGEWMGAKGHNIFSFHPNVRPVPLEIRIMGLEVSSFEGRQLAMVKHCYEAIANHAGDKPALVFVPSRKHARRVTLDFVTAAAAEGNGSKFLHCDEDDLAPHLKHLSSAVAEGVRYGVGQLHLGMTDRERAVVERLFGVGALQVVVVEVAMCWALGPQMLAHTVVVMDTQVYDGNEHRYVDLPITDVLQMVGRAGRPLEDAAGKCVILTYGPKKEFYKKFLYEPFPVESHLDHFLHDHLNAEIITKRVENVQDAVDYLTWSFFYRRLTLNPNYYRMQGVSHRHVSDRLSELVETVLDELQTSKCISIEDETDLASLNLGMIAGFYYLRYTTVELFSSALTDKAKLREILEILSTATEFEKISVRHKEDVALERLARHLPLKIADANFNSSATKTNVLLQAHFSRVNLSAAVSGDQVAVMPDANRLLQAIVDVISSSRWLKPALAAMELSQMVTMGMWNTDPVLMQIPHVTKEKAMALQKSGVATVADLLEMEDDDRVTVLGMTPPQLSDVARFCNAYPDVSVQLDVAKKDTVVAGKPVSVTVTLERSPEEDEEDFEEGVQTVVAPRFPQPKAEGWWVVLGDVDSNELLVIKRVSLKSKVTTVKLDFAAPASPGEHGLTMFLMSDSWVGADQEYPVTLNVKENTSMSDGEEEDEEDSD